MLYAAGIFLAAFFGAVAIFSGGAAAVRESQGPRRRERRAGAATRASSPSSRSSWRQPAQSSKSTAARSPTSRHSSRTKPRLPGCNAEQLEQKIRELEAERDGLLELVATERERFEHTLDELGGGLGRHGNELAELERELEALIAR